VPTRARRQHVRHGSVQGDAEEFDLVGCHDPGLYMAAPIAMNSSVNTGSSSKNGSRAVFHWRSSASRQKAVRLRAGMRSQLQLGGFLLPKEWERPRCTSV
jgi:hypothetical protein